MPWKTEHREKSFAQTFAFAGLLAASWLLWMPAALADLSELEGDHGHQTQTTDTPSTPPAQPIDDGLSCPGDSPCIETATQLTLRVLPRPFSNIYQEPVADGGAIVQANPPAFRPLYAFERRDIDLRQGAEPRGWYRVGRTRTQADGWMQAKDVFEWRQALLVSFTHPGDPIEGRHPVLMFKDRETLQAIVDDMDMAASAQSLYDEIDRGGTPEAVISLEPKRFVDITTNFYMLPILQWSQTQIDGDDVRLLQLASAVPGARGADTLQTPEYREQAQTGRDTADQGIEDIAVDIVFVIDTTRSMQPFIDMTRDAVAKMARNFSERTQDRFRFGLVTYRDSLEAVPALDYLTRNHTPTLVTAERLAEILDTDAKATRVGSLGYDEDVFAGVDAALRQSPWREKSIKFVILIGDASSHLKGDAHNSTRKDETDLRREYDDANVHLLAIHLQNPKAAEDFPRALQQFGTLARIRGNPSQQALEQVDTSQDDAYRRLVDRVTAGINTELERTLAAKAPAAPTSPGSVTSPTVPGTPPAETPEVLSSVSGIWQAALIEYIGQSANPPKDIVAWSLDRDLINPADRALEVRVLVTREQLSSLAQALDSVMQALMRAEVTQAQFLESLQSVSGQAMKRPDDLAQAQRLADTGLLPAFIQSLPYRSDVLALTDEMFASMTAEQRAQLEWSILAKLEQYRAINDQVDAWFRLNDTDADSDMVYPLHIDYLP